ncbi:TonB-dependent receptor [Sphingosinicella terrae]|uniref:TonB-dependent receptor n=1 Tax=Sphingosinicella terrae TaxID=2172047 RepID=UPI0025480D25|nr:TonB-dependent receptor [Sphingosinicella terrae]
MKTASTRLRRLIGVSMLATLAAAGTARAETGAAESATAAAAQGESAQDPADPAAAPLEVRDENDILVTARRRSESLQDVPAAITAFTSENIEAAGIERPADFVNLTSNVQLVETQNAGTSFIIIRGITQARNSEPSVAVIIDGVQQVNPSQFNQTLFDIEQIEVLKGPQGGLYGRNAIGGAIVIRTRQPSDTFEGQATVGVDNGFGYYLRGTVSGPISDTLRFRVSGAWYDTEGFIRNTYLGEDADPVEDLSLRATLLWTPTDSFSADLRASMNQLRTQALYFNIVADVNDTSLPVRVNNAGQNDRDIYNVSLRLNYETDFGTFTSVTSYDTLEEILTGDQFDFLPIEESLFFQILGFDLTQSQFLDVEAISQEIRFTSPEDRRLRYIIGAYAIDTNRYISTGNMVDTGNGVFPVFRTPSTNPLNPQASFLADRQDNFAWAVFANASYEISDQFEVDLSLRYDRDRRRQTTLTPPAFLPNVPGFPPVAQTGEVRRVVFDDWQPKVTLTWEPTPNLTVYGGYSRGFRSGGFNQTGVGVVALANGFVGVEDIYLDETADTFEIGARAQLLNRRLTLSANAFTTKSENSYFFVFLAANSTQNLGNVPEVRLEGFELEARARIAEGFDVNAGLGYTWSEIKAFPDPSVIGNEAPLISRYTWNLGAQYRGDLGTSGLGLLARIDYRRTGRTWWDVPNSTVRRPVDLVNARLGVEGENWSLTAFAENLFDETYNAEFSPGGFVFKARPRRYGAELMFRF